MPSREPIAPEDCPEPFWHETHYYCPVCTWRASTCTERRDRTVGEYRCEKPEGHSGQHEVTVKWGPEAPR